MFRNRHLDWVIAVDLDELLTPEAGLSWEKSVGSPPAIGDLDVELSKVLRRMDQVVPRPPPVKTIEQDALFVSMSVVPELRFGGADAFGRILLQKRRQKREFEEPDYEDLSAFLPSPAQRFRFRAPFPRIMAGNKSHEDAYYGSEFASPEASAGRSVHEDEKGVPLVLGKITYDLPDDAVFGKGAALYGEAVNTSLSAEVKRVKILIRVLHFLKFVAVSWVGDRGMG